MPKKYKYTKSFSFDGKRYYVHGDTMEEVYEKKANKMRDLKDGKVIVSKSMTVEQWTEICLETYKPNVSDEVKKDMSYRINKHIIGEFGYKRLKDVTPLDCQRLMSKQSDMSSSHIKKLYQELHFIFEKARKNHLILENPADDLSIPEGHKNERRSITKEERKHFLAVAENYQPFILFKLMLYCGCRPGEAAKCLGSDISTNGHTPLLHIRGTKTANSDRLVPIPDILYTSIKNTPKNDYIAPNNANKQHDDSSYSRLVKRLYREMNISMGCKVYRNQLIEPLPLADDFVPYDFRHTYCTDLQKAGVDVRVAQRLMGHASIEITSNIYTHIDMDDISDAYELINYNHSRV